jgi:putative membrane protein
MIKNFDDHSANERTFLAWVRTAVAIVGFGLVAARVGPPQNTYWSEILLLISGAIVVVIAYFRKRALRKRISLAQEFDSDKIPADMLLLLLVIAMFATLAMFAVNVS